MGCDGGTIPKRDELVRTKKKGEQKDKTSDLSFRWQHCSITQQPLQLPVVACEMGRMYSKESVIECLLDNKTEENAMNEVAPHIKSLKDVKQLVLTDNPDWIELSRGEHGDGYIDVQKSKWICPISSMEMSGRFRFCFLWTCGCVFSEKALKEMIKLKEEGNECLRCQKHFQVLDIVLLNPVEQRDIITLQEKMDLRRILAKDAKAAKDAAKAGKKRAAASATVTSSESTSSSSVTEVDVDTKLGNGSSPNPEITTASTSSLSSTKKPKLVLNTKSGTTSTTTTGNRKNKAGTSAYSVAKDPGASEVYKSLFTTHNNATTQERAHWVTYNPFYN